MSAAELDIAPSTLLWNPSAPEDHGGHHGARRGHGTSDDPTANDEHTFDDSRKPLVRLRPGYCFPGTRLRLTGWLGEGATAVVYRGQHIDLGRPLAIKVLRDPSASAAARDRFLSEARITSEIDSPYVVDVAVFGELEDGRLYYAMALLGARSLDELLERGPVSPQRAITLLRMACKGLAAAHDAGIVHRDIKPENLMLVRRRGKERLVIVDFGIATPSGPTTGALCGTPYFMAPEQITGDPVDGRTDIYALGCCAYEMLCGRHFVDGHDVDVVMSRHLSPNRPTLPSDCDVPKPLRQVVQRCLALDPNDRYASAAQLEAALCEAQIAAGLRCPGDALEPPEVDEDRRLRIARSLARPRRRGRIRQVAMATAAGLVLVAASAGWMHEHQRRADEAVTRIDRIAAGARAAADDARYLYPKRGASYDTAYQHLMRLERWDGPGRDHAEAMATALRAELSEALVLRADRMWNDPDRRGYARDHYAQALVFQPDHPRARARVGMTPGELAELRHKATARSFSEAEIETARALTSPQRSREAGPQETARPSKPRARQKRKKPSALARRLAALSLPPKPTTGAHAEPELEPRDETTRKQPAHHPERARRLVRQARRSLRAGDRSRARALFERAAALDTRNARAYAGLADVYFEEGRHERALHFARMAVRRDPNNASHRVRLGDSYFRVAQPDRARRQYERAAALGSAQAARRIEELADG